MGPRLETFREHLELSVTQFHDTLKADIIGLQASISI